MDISDRLPPGAIFRYDKDRNLEKFLSAFDTSLEAIKTFSTDMIADLDPRTTTNYVNEWGRLLDIQAELDALGTISAKRALIVSKLTVDEIKTQQYFIDKAAALGYTIEFKWYGSFRAGKWRAGQPVMSGEYADYTILISVTTTDNAAQIELPRAGVWRAGQIYSPHGIAELEIAILEDFPIGLNLLFEYDDGVTKIYTRTTT